MLTLYICFLAGGAVLPITSFLFGLINNFLDADVDVDADVDAVDVDVNTGPDLDAELDTVSELEADSDIDTDIDSGANVVGAANSALSIALFPSSLMSISTLAIVFGAIGSIMTMKGKGALITLIIAAVSGYLASITVQSILKTLRRIQTRNGTINENELMLYDGKVVDTILPGQTGSVSFVSLSNIRVTYPAKCADESLRLAAGRTVRVKEIRNGIVIVEPKNKYE
ncbi:MAG: hypothetical protein GX757_00400 [Clostridiales bacterium]|nr:hypothetical protein [Clostridiales bacterium]